MAVVPLSETLRPSTLENFVGQEHLVGDEGIVRKLLESAKTTGRLPSLLLWGPPGVGKTTLARIIAAELGSTFYEFSAVNASTKDIEAVIPVVPKLSQSSQLTLSPTNPTSQTPPIIFLDEIHRFNKAQQDKLLPHIENGAIVLIGATTENPSFEVVGPLLSRTRVLVLKQLGENHLKEISLRALENSNKKIAKDAEEFLLTAANGDARVLINVLEIASSLSNNKTLALQDIEQALQRRQLSFDLRGEEYYNTISSYLKSMRASNVDAALYYLARMVESGQDPLYIARRMVVFASEDIGIAQSTALVVANEVFKACETIGYPECVINLAHGTVYLAKAKKNRTAYDAYFRAVDDVKKYGNLPIPMNLRNAPTKLMKDQGYGKDYTMYPDKSESLLPEKLKGKKYYEDS